MGNFGVVYEGSFQVRATHADTVTVQLLEKNHSAAPKPMRLAADPIRREVSKPGSDKLIGLLPQVVEVRLAASETAVIDAIYSSSVPWRVAIKVDGSIDFYGPLRKNLRSTSADKFSTESLVVYANCGLGTLQKQSFYPIQRPEAHEVRGQWILAALRELGLGLDVAMASEFWAPHMSNTQNPLFQETINPRAWHDDEKWMTQFEVLDELVSEKGMFLVQEGGMWHCYQRQLYRQSSFDRWVYSADHDTRTDAGPSAETFSAEISAADPGYTERTKGGTDQSAAEYSAVDVVYHHGSVDDLVPQYSQFDGDPAWKLDMGVDDTGNPFLWHQGAVEDNGNPVEQQLTERAKLDELFTLLQGTQYLLKADYLAFIGDEAQGGAPYDLLGYVKMRLKATDGTQYFLKRQVAADPDDVDRLQYQDPTWMQDSSVWTAWIMPWDGEPDPTIEAELTVPPLPDTGTLYLEVGNILDPRPSRFTDQTAYAVYASEPALQPIDPEGGSVGTTRYRAEATAISSTNDPYEVQVETGSGPTASHESATRESDAVGADPILDWDTAPMASGDQGDLSAELLAKELLYQLAPEQDKVLEYRYLVDEVPCAMTKVIVRGAIRYLPKHLSYHYKRGMRSVVAKPLAYDDTLSISTQRIRDDSGSGGSGGGAGTDKILWRQIESTPQNLYARGGDSDGFGETIALPSEASSYLPGPMPGNSHFAFVKLFRHPFTVSALTIYAYTPPSQNGGFDFDVQVSGTAITNVTLGQGVQQDSWSLDFDVAAMERLEVVPGQAGTADDLADVAFVFELIH